MAAGTGTVMSGRTALAQQMSGATGSAFDTGGMAWSFDPRVNLRGQAERMLGSAPPPSSPNQRAWTLDGAVTLEERFMVPGQASAGSKAPSAEYVTNLSPSVVLSGQTQRVTVNLNYRPQAQYYLENKKQNRIDQNLTGSAQATIIPEAVFVDARALTTVQSRVANQAPQGLSTLNKQDTIQTSNFSISPYAKKRFGSLGTLEGGYSFSDLIRSNATSTIPGAANNGSTLTNKVYLGFVTGESLGRFNDNILASATKFDGAGIMQNAHRYIANNELGYAITRNITMLAAGGIEDIRYGGTPGVRISDAIWSVGVTLRPNDLSTLTMRYAHRDGISAPSLDATYQPFARIRLTLRYADGLASDAEEIQNRLATASLDSAGNAYDSSTGAPIFGSSNTFSPQSALNRVKTMTSSIIYILDRDTVSVGLTRTQRSPLSVQAGAPAANSSSLLGNLSWMHEFTSDVSVSSFLQYGTQSTASLAGGDSKLLLATVSTGYAISQTLTASLRYMLNKRSSNTPTGNTTQHMIIVSLHKGF